jgi:hypothetical protein
MAPKTPAHSNDQFLAACFKHCKDKPVVDFVEVAKDIGMSSGGAQ